MAFDLASISGIISAYAVLAGASESPSGQERGIPLGLEKRTFLVESKTQAV